MNFTQFASMLRKNGYRDTQPRRMVLQAMIDLHVPVSPYDIQKHIANAGGAMSAVTAYRVIELLQILGIVHKHPCSGKFALCNHIQKSGMHGYLHCHSCGTTEEFCSPAFSILANKQAKKSGFETPTSSLLELSGKCRSCKK